MEDKKGKLTSEGLEKVPGHRQRSGRLLSMRGVSAVFVMVFQVIAVAALLRLDDPIHILGPPRCGEQPGPLLVGRLSVVEHVEAGVRVRHLVGADGDGGVLDRQPQ